MSKLIKSKRLKFIVGFSLLVWSLWIYLQGWSESFDNVVQHFTISLTMVFGSFVAGISSLGGGTVAFPVFTKLLQIPAFDSKVFSLMIQSVGMTSASIFIIINRIKVEWKVILLGSLAGIVGITFGSYVIAPQVSSLSIKVLFTMMLTSFGITLIVLNKRKEKRHQQLPKWSSKEKLVVLLAGGAGGILSGLHGSGIDIMTFSVMVLLFRMDEKVATPTSVVIMAFNAIVGTVLHNYVFQNATNIVIDYWLAAVPVVVIGAPIGALVCDVMRRESINAFLLVLIGIELVSTLFFVPMNSIGLWVGIYSLLLFSLLNFFMLRVKNYRRI